MTCVARYFVRRCLLSLKKLLTLRKKLENPQFVERAKPEVVAQARQRIAELEERRAKVKATLDELGRL